MSDEIKYLLIQLLGAQALAFILLDVISTTLLSWKLTRIENKLEHYLR